MEGDFRLFDGEGPPAENPNWMELARCSGFPGVRHARQVHGKGILLHRGPTTGLSLGPDGDGHAASAPGTLLAVTVADCVPVFLVDPRHRAVALLHAGWRGAAAGILEEGISLLQGEFQTSESELLVHLGPAICGSCYEVGPEVHGALGLPLPEGPTPVDLRGALAERAVSMGVLPSQITRSVFCTLCGGSPFFSHRAGESRRQVGFLGIRPS
jgi:YfiH family protein